MTLIPLQHDYQDREKVLEDFQHDKPFQMALFGGIPVPNHVTTRKELFELGIKNVTIRFDKLKKMLNLQL